LKPETLAQPAGVFAFPAAEMHPARRHAKMLPITSPEVGGRKACRDPSLLANAPFAPRFSQSLSILIEARGDFSSRNRHFAARLRRKIL
ncbi:hypothetical protein, partial [Burkholderia ubonensis]|uniref:hypothetical protein n=1 Tax=Burkholderia ubonensis TaxID=101571 RepID=UPI001E32B219